MTETDSNSPEYTQNIVDSHADGNITQAVFNNYNVNTPKSLGSIGLPPTISNSFVDSKSRIDLIRSHFIEQNGTFKSSVSPLALIANGGFGKSRVAIEFAHETRNIYASQLWIRADSLSILQQQISNLAKLPGLAIQGASFLDEPVQINLVLMQLPQLSQHGLLIIFDGIEDEETATLLKSFVSKLGGVNVLITTRIRKWGKSITQVELPLLPENEAERYLIESRASNVLLTEEEYLSIHML